MWYPTWLTFKIMESVRMCEISPVSSAIMGV